MATIRADGAVRDLNAVFDRCKERLRRTVRLRLDREVLTLRHCEQLSNDETAAVLNIPRSQASEAYMRALERITQIMAALLGFKGKS
jgi:DNA-directed RNA polymerase specialized sigma subunit